MAHKIRKTQIGGELQRTKSHRRTVPSSSAFTLVVRQEHLSTFLASRILDPASVSIKSLLTCILRISW